MDNWIRLPTRTWKGLKLFTIPDDKVATSVWDPDLYMKLPCKGTPRISIHVQPPAPGLMETPREYMRVLMTAYPPIREGFHRGMRCPIVLRCKCKQSRCIGNTAQNVQVPPPLHQMDFPGIRIVAWKEFLENWNVHREGVWEMYDLPPIFALDMTGVMDLID